MIDANSMHRPTRAAFCGRLRVISKYKSYAQKKKVILKHTPIPKVSSLYTLISSSSSAMACSSPQSILAPSSSLHSPPFSGHSHPFSACGTDGWRITWHRVEVNLRWKLPILDIKHLPGSQRAHQSDKSLRITHLLVAGLNHSLPIFCLTRSRQWPWLPSRFHSCVRGSLTFKWAHLLVAWACTSQHASR